MDNRHDEWLSLLEDPRVTFEEKYEISNLIAAEARTWETEPIDAPRLYKAVVKFWQNLGLRTFDRYDENLFPIRKQLARVCRDLSHRLPGPERFFMYFPRISNVEGPDPDRRKEILSGSIRNAPGWLSIYEFHWEYPINGFGVRKDKISVISENGMRTPLLDWCEKHDIIVFCGRCGLDITYSVSKDCPWIKSRIKS